MKSDKKSLLLYAVTDRSWLGGKTLYEQVEEAIKAGVTFVQLREKNLDEKSFLDEALEIQKLCRNYNILVVDDDREIVESIAIFLSGEGYKVFKAYDGIEALEILSETQVHLMILDIMMPRLDGIKTLLKLRESRNMPVILLSAKSEDSDKIFGLTAGADDYVTKPFNPSELVARVKSQLRRYITLGSIGKHNGEIIVDGLCVNTESKTVKVDGVDVRLTPIEYKILELLAKNRGRVFSVEDIYSNVWNEETVVGDNTIAVHIRHIREKIEINPKEPKYLKVVWGIGYKID